MVRQISYIPSTVHYVDGVEFGRAGRLPCCHEVEGFEQGPKRIEDRREDAWEGLRLSSRIGRTGVACCDGSDGVWLIHDPKDPLSM